MDTTDNEKRVMAKPQSVTLALVQVKHKEKINIMTNQDNGTNIARRPTSGDDINARSHANVTNITSNEYYQDSVPITIQGYMIHPVESPDFWGTSCSTLTANAIPRIKTGFIHKS